MIARLTGKLLERSPNRVILDVNGVGYELRIPLSTYYRLAPPGGEATLTVYTHVREDALILFGFGTSEEKDLFEKLISISGVGPAIGIGVLSGMEVDEFIRAVLDKETARICTIPGIGRKTADRIVLELKDKIGAIPVAPAAPERPVAHAERDVVSALVNLGYPERQAEKACARVRDTLKSESGFEEILRATLRILSG